MTKLPREADTRQANARKPLKNPNKINENFNLGAEWKLRWVRKYFNGAEEDKTNFFRRRQQGWEPVKASELSDEFQYLKDNDGLIAKDGCILCKIPASVAADHAAYYEQLALGQLEGAMSEFKSNGRDERMPKFSEGRQRVIRGSMPN
jgi:hypothetical protein